MPSAWAVPRTSKPQYIWLADLLDSFGAAGGFDSLKAAVTENANITGTQMALLVRPFGGTVASLLTKTTIEIHFVPIRNKMQQFVGDLTEASIQGENLKGIIDGFASLADIEEIGHGAYRAKEMMEGALLRLSISFFIFVTHHHRRLPCV